MVTAPDRVQLNGSRSIRARPGDDLQCRDDRFPDVTGEVGDIRVRRVRRPMGEEIQSIASPGPAMKPSSDIDLFTTTLPVPVLISLILFLRASP